MESLPLAELPLRYASWPLITLTFKLTPPARSGFFLT